MDLQPTRNKVKRDKLVFPPPIQGNGRDSGLSPHFWWGRDFEPTLIKFSKVRIPLSTSRLQVLDTRDVNKWEQRRCSRLVC